MALTHRKFPQSGVYAIFLEAPGGGDPEDINSLRNRPAANPTAWLANIFLHSSLDNFEVSHSGTPTISHAAVAAGSLPAGQTIVFGWKAAAADHLLLAHNLGYVPFAFVAQGDNVLWPGMPVQTDASGGARYVSAYCTSTGIYLYEWASIGSSSLAAANLSYTVWVIRNPRAPSGNKLESFDPLTGIFTAGFDRFNTSRRYLQAVPGGSPLGISYGRTIDLDNGAPRAVRPDGTTFDPVPPTLKLGIYDPTLQSGPTAYGAGMHYQGAFTGPTSIQVQAP